MTDPEVEKVWQEFWVPLVAENGVPDIEQIKKELCDYHNFMLNAATVYMHVTGNKISKVNTLAESIIAVADDETARSIEEAVKEAQEEFRSDEGLSHADHGALTEAVNALLTDVRRRYNNTDWKCPFFQKLADLIGFK